MQISKEYMPYMVKYRPALSMSFTFHDYWSYRTHKQGSEVLFPQDFVKTTLYFGKRYITSIQNFIKLYGYDRVGVYNYHTFQEHIREDLGLKVRVVFGWDEGETTPPLVKLRSV